MPHPARRTVRVLIFLLLAVVGVGGSQAHADVIIDNGDPGTSGSAWQVSSAAGYYGSKSVWARDGLKYSWTFTPSVSGTYDVSMWWTELSSRSTRVPVSIAHAGGTSTVYVNQVDNGGQWNVLGRYVFTAGQSYRVVVTAQPYPTSTCADAVKFASVDGGANQPPAAVNDTASTTEGSPVSVNVVSNDLDDGGVDVTTVEVVAAPQHGGAVSNGNGTVTYTPDVDFTGADTFTYTVADSQGAVSNEATVTVTVSAVSAEHVIDNGGAGTSSTGTWAVSGALGSYGSASVWARDGARYTYTFTPSATGSYQLSMWWTTYSSRSASVPVAITHAGGTSTVTVNQKEKGSQWNVLGTYNLAAGQSYTVTITSQPGPSSTCADAVKFTYLSGGGENQPPTAVNDTATTSMNAPVSINVLSNDTDDTGVNATSVSIVSPPSSGTAVPNSNGTVTYTPGEDTTGTDTFTYTVADSEGLVSNAATVTVTVSAASTEFIIDNGGPGTTYTGAWEVSGAAGYYGSKSVWGRYGTKYNWSFTPSVTGMYQVSMWWTEYSSRATSIPVDITHAAGTTRVIINQQQNGARWNGLGVVSLIAGTTYRVTVTSQAYPTSTCADAVKFTFLQDTVGYVAVGDSITAGEGDDIPSDGTGYEPILASLLTASRGYPVIVSNEGVGGVDSLYGAENISSTLAKYPAAKYVLVLYGTNDSDILYGGPTPSGLGLRPGDAGYAGSYKDNIQRIVSAVVASGKIPGLAKVPYTPNARYDIMSIQEYNLVIDELVAANLIAAVPPDFYSWFLNHPDQLADTLHPDGLGYQAMAGMWAGALP